jgi:plasmid stabilization system protein ParE
VTIDIDPAALLEIEEAAVWYEAQVADLGRRFSEAARAAIGDAAQEPFLAREIEPDVRKWNVAHFPYAILFRHRRGSGLLTVIAVMHLHREPGYWRGR